ncbi:uncharacterized protein BROUX77_002813 [Berkeleyomyces rouxiae]|uniref:uncharacterized protein n=1 Tax=Berkeleyomyces rouxiae TaxID=2035830 RepID=UPI003B76D1F1
MTYDKDHGRQYDIVVLGATGYTGRLTCEYIVKEFPPSLKWAIAGRSAEKLQQLAESIKSLDGTKEPPALEVCDSSTDATIALVRKTFILLTCAGPYHLYGEPAFRACAENGTHYIDVCGEVVHTKKMSDLYAGAASQSGAIMLPQCGIESAPVDISTWALAQTLQRELGAATGPVTVALEIHGSPSGGTLATAFSLLDSFSLADMKSAYAPYAWSPVARPATSAPPPPQSWWARLTGLRNVPGLGLLTTSLAARTDGALVERSWGLMESVPSLKAFRYGPDFSFAEYFRPSSALRGVMVHFFTIAMQLVIATPPLRAWARSYVTQPGNGPSRDQANKETIEYTGIAVPSPDAMGKRAFSQVNYSGPMYYLTGLLAMEAARVLLEVDTKLEGGVYTPACLGDHYITRLANHGFKLETKIIDA